jgi:hypothetical protein
LRLRVIDTTDRLRARSLASTDAWSGVVVEHVARRLGQTPGDALPRLVGGAAFIALRTARRTWQDDPRSDLVAEVGRCFDALIDLTAAIDAAAPRVRRR